MNIIAIDPGNTESAYCLMQDYKPVEFGKIANEALLTKIHYMDDSLVVPDHQEHRNFVKYSWKGATRYVDINSITNKSWGSYISKAEMPIADAPTLRPFNLEAGLNKQLALRLSVPKDAKAGVYRGKMRVKNAEGVLAEVPVEVEVLPFTLPADAETSYDPARNYTMGIYTWTRMDPGGKDRSMSPFNRSP